MNELVVADIDSDVGEGAAVAEEDEVSALEVAARDRHALARHVVWHAPVEDARAAEERVLGSADDDERFLAYQPFTHEIAACVVVKTSLGQALADFGRAGRRGARGMLCPKTAP